MARLNNRLASRIKTWLLQARYLAREIKAALRLEMNTEEIKL